MSAPTIEGSRDAVFPPVQRPDGERRAIVALVIVFWFAFQAVFFTYGVLASGDESVSPSRLLWSLLTYVTQPVEIAIVAVGALFSIAVYVLLRGVQRRPLWQQLLTATLAATICALCFAIAVSILCDLFGVTWPPLTLRFLIVDTLRWIAPFGLWAGVTLTVTYNSEVRERERRLTLLQAREKAAQMRALRYQVNPHLLYNTLNAIAALILDRQNDLAEAMVVRLSNFFRASLSNDPHADVPLVDEVALQRLYLDIEQMRFPRLTIEFDVPDELAPVSVPSLILQPLIENVLKHGMNPDGAPTHLIVRASGTPERLVLEVADNGPGSSTNLGMGVGLSNVRERLIARFGNHASVETESQPGQGYLVRIAFPGRRP